jgi:hypothetical protein
MVANRACLVLDACVHTDVLTKGEAHWEFKLFLIELAIEWVEQKHQLLLSRGTSIKWYSNPSMSFH